MENVAYKETKFLGLTLRSFTPDSQELVWHTDNRNRLILVLKSDGWRFQKDNKLPYEINPLRLLLIKKNTWHRVLSGKGKLLVIFKEF